MKQKFLRRAGLTCALTIIGIGVLSLGLAQTPKKALVAKKPPKVNAVPQAAPTTVRPAVLGYNLAPNQSVRYKILALLNGYFPPLAQPGSPRMNVKIAFEYVATVKKQDKDGAEIEYKVDTADIALLEKEPGEDGKIKPEEEIPFPVPLSQIQTALDVTVRVKPDGSVQNITGGDPNVKGFNFGIELRKLFLISLPTIFPQNALKPGDEWKFDDGILGKKPEKTTYKGRLLAVKPEGKALAFQIDQNAEAIVEDYKDKSGNPTQKLGEAIDTLTGKVTVTSDVKFVTPQAAATRLEGRVASGKMLLTANLLRKRTQPDPEHPEDAMESTIDIKGRFFVQSSVQNSRKAAKAVTASATSGK